MAGTSLSSLSSPIQTYALRRPIKRYHRHRNRNRRPNRTKTFLCYTAPPRSEQPIGETHKEKPEKDKSLRVLHWLKLDAIGLEIVSIALPAVLALAADPLASLVDTAFVGHLGSAELAAVGVSVSVFNLVSKLLNVPLLNVTTSFVAEQQALDANQEEVSEAKERRKYLPAVSTSLALAAGIGLLEAVALMFGSGFLMNAMGIPIDSPMRAPAEQFLTLRAYGAPPIVIALAAQGTFRGFKDTKTPLYAVGLGNLVNAILDVILILLLGLGVRGAAIATVTSEYLIAFILLWKLNEQVVLVSPSVIGDGVTRYLKSGGLLIGRTIAVLLTTTLATSLAAREGPVPMAGYQICLQVWLAVSLLNDALALAGQALLAGEYTKGNYKQARVIIYRVLQISGITGAGLAVVLFFGFGTFSLVFTSDSQVLEIARSGLWCFVGLVSCGYLLLVTPGLGLTGVWTGLVLFMTLRVLAGFLRTIPVTPYNPLVIHVSLACDKGRKDKSQSL
ncbi:MATE efflux family protein 2 [Carex littledalei]|uniref:Protein DETOXIFICATION n=1 Tax=Carex littledalei TaxID=544730 RepID=A0A833QXF0_9POAL|nr:MATE efflux family protein 2 [Carex littledalei]